MFAGSFGPRNPDTVAVALQLDLHRACREAWESSNSLAELSGRTACLVLGAAAGMLCVRAN